MDDTHKNTEWYKEIKKAKEVTIAESEDLDKLKTGVSKTLDRNKKLRIISPIIFNKAKNVFTQVLGRFKDRLNSLL
jgi:hypothetical protein